MDHGIEHRRTHSGPRIAKLMNAPLVAATRTTSAHFDRRLLQCINRIRALTTQTDSSSSGDGYYIRSSDEMRSLWSEL